MVKVSEGDGHSMEENVHFEQICLKRVCMLEHFVIFWLRCNGLFRAMPAVKFLLYRALCVLWCQKRHVI